MNNDNAKTPSRNTLIDPELATAWALQMRHGKEGRVYHLLNRCLHSRRMRDLGELTPAARLFNNPVIDVLALEEPLMVFYESEGRKYTHIAAKILDEFVLGMGFQDDQRGEMRWFEFVVRIKKDAFLLKPDLPDTDPRVLPETETETEDAIFMVVCPFDVCFLSPPDDKPH